MKEHFYRKARRFKKRIQIIKKRSVLILSLIVLVNFAIDQISKNSIRSHLNDNEIINVFNDNIILEKAENAGAAMGLGANLPSAIKTIYFQLLPVFFLIFLFRMILVETSLTKLTKIGVAFAVGGGLGNVFDRILHGVVTDFIVVKIGSFQTGIFNIADISVVIGILLAFTGLILNRESYK